MAKLSRVPVAVPTRIRKNVRNLTTTELNQVRKGYELMYSLNAQDDYRSYCKWAGYHGIPDHFCPHGNQRFLTWHRAYMYGMENTMGQLLGDPSFALPYWDWTSQVSQNEGIPKAYTDTTYVDKDGNTKPNPLLTAIKCYDGTQTTRRPGAPPFLGFLETMVSAAINNTNSYDEFNARIEQPHNSLHGWVSGDMGAIDTAAYDPVFYAHHCNVDRQWWQWQQKNPGVNPEDLDVTLTPWNMQVKDVLTTNQLGYVYAAATIIPLSPTQRGVATALPALNQHLSNFKAKDLEKDFSNARLELHDVSLSIPTFKLHVFLNTPSANEKTPTENNPNYAGSYYFFGKSAGCTGGQGHCNPPQPGDDNLVRTNHMSSFNANIDITTCLKGICKSNKTVDVNLVGVDYQGKPVQLDKLDLGNIGIVLED